MERKLFQLDDDESTCQNNLEKKLQSNDYNYYAYP
ncbi:unnamed protein product [Schistosoma margrebowiei]|uniref:Uncharacterized protein n=1 Tax=Schistosoma margrebowiei TaxID=48269 RepID=A0A183NC93_9TREM|nr:unnamed protein product [Schistosoma margrebowiei]